MKKQLLLLLLVLFTGAAFSQNCGFTIASNTSGAVNFVPASGFPGSFYSWNFGDNSTGTSFGPVTHSYNASGPYIVCMNVQDSMGMVLCSFCDSIYIQPSVNCNFTVNQIPGAMYINFFATPPPGAFASWSYGDGTSGIGSNSYHTYSSNGTYNVCLSIIDTSTGAANVLCTGCQQVYLGTTNNCSMTAFPDSMNNTLYYFFGSAAYSTSTISWNYGDGSNGTGSFSQHYYAQPGIYTACMNEINPNGLIVCSTCTTISVNFTSPQCVFYAGNGTQPGSIVLVSGYNGPAAQIVWDLGNGTTGVGPNYTVTYNAPGVYNVCMSAIDSSGIILCSSCQSISILPPPPPACAAYFVASSAAMTTSFIELSTGVTPMTTFSWSFGDGTGSSVRFPQHTYSMPGTYQACLTIADSMCQDQYCTTVIADTTNNPTGPCAAQFVTLQVAPFDVVVIDLSTGTNLSYFWDFGDGTTSNQQYPSHYYSTIGSYNLCLTVSNGLLGGCSSTFCDTLSVDSMGNVFRTMTGFNINVSSPSAFTGISGVSCPAICSIYPNPATDVVILQRAAATKGLINYRLFNLQGSVVLSGSANVAVNAISVRELPSGTYVMEVTDEAANRSFIKVVRN